MGDMVQDHTKDVAEFRAEARNGKDAELRNFASQAVATLEDHLKQAKSLTPQSAIGVPGVISHQHGLTDFSGGRYWYRR